jgi:8-amino-7-oxononanoate synthase
MASLANKKLQQLLAARKAENNYRQLKTINFSEYIDFASNDYLGFTRKVISDNNLPKGSTGSRLISGNHIAYEKTEKYICEFLQAEAALIFNSGYTANLGLLSCIPQKNDLIIYDELSHASIKDGVRLSFANRFSFKHNDVNDLEKKLKNKGDTKYVVIESVYSMDGDIAPLCEIASLCNKYQAHLIVDEAHAFGILGKQGRGLVDELALQQNVFARLITFGKALGLHGAAILSNKLTCDFLINFCRPFIYTTALPPEHIIHIYDHLNTLENNSENLRYDLKHIIMYFKTKVSELGLTPSFYLNDTPIQVCMLNDATLAKNIADRLWQQKIYAKAILHPTVAKGKERIRICLHSYNSESEIDLLLNTIKQYV